MANDATPTPLHTHIRHADSMDVIKIQQLARLSWEQNYAEMLPPEQIAYMLENMYGERTLREHFANPNYHYLLLSVKDARGWETIGFIGFEHGYELKTTKLHRLYFLKEYTGKGLGAKLIAPMLEAVKHAGDERVILQVNKRNAAARFYERMGFAVYDAAVLDIGGGYVMDDYLMEYKM
ncbi:MAG: GNAT family N-acetyltransferase [Weeksellaceae bacterium]|nr:GNAT family N-acetyltransferase [Weeksellaceae bacterium]